MINHLEYDYFESDDLSDVLMPGEATFKITSAITGMSKAGNDMMTVTFAVTDSNGKNCYIDDYLVATKGFEAGMKRLATKIRNIANAINKPELYAPGAQLRPGDLIGYNGKCIVKTQSSDLYPDKSVISKYIDATKNAGLPDDELGF